jgi:cytochrome c551/c552
LLAQWKKTTQVNLDRLNRIYRDVVDSIKNMPNKHKIELQKLLDSAYYNIHLVEVGKSVHNIEYSERLLGASYEYIKKAVKFASPPYELPVFKGSSVNVPSECASCHYGIGETKVEVYGITFSHSRHAGANRIACVTCHSNAKKHGELVMEKEGCTSCHHKRTTNVDCQNCHQLENEFYGGGYMGLSQPNVMESGVGCVDCHLSNQKVVKPSGSVCLNCHEKGYDETMTKWQQATKKQVDDIKRLTLSLKSVNLSPALKKSLEAVDHLIVDIEKSSAWGVHNYEMISTMLARKQKELSQFTISN